MINDSVLERKKVKEIVKTACTKVGEFIPSVMSNDKLNCIIFFVLVLDEFSVCSNEIF
jgi:hypothetical protein